MRFKAIWIAITRPQYVITCDQGMTLLKEIWNWTTYKNTPWYKNTEQVLKQYYDK
jgi:hypothetical protein